MSTSPANKRLKIQFKIDPNTGEQFKYSRKVDEWELTKFIIVESLYSKTFTDSLEKYIQIFLNFLCAESILYTKSFLKSLTIYIRTAHFPAYQPIP